MYLKTSLLHILLSLPCICVLIIFLVILSPTSYASGGASDTFTRSVTGGWGSADVGGSYTLTGTAADFNVNGTEGTTSVTAAGQNKTGLLNSVSAQDTDSTVSVKTDKAPTGATEVAYLIARHISTGNEYRGRLILNTNNSVVVSVSKLVGGTETALGSQVTVSGLTYATNTYINFRFDTVGISPTTLEMRAWASGSAEPGTWQTSTTDSDSVLQAAGSVGMQGRLSSSVSNAPVLFTFDNYTSTNNDPTPTPTATPTPTPVVNYSLSGTVFNDANSNGSQDGGENGYQGATVAVTGPTSSSTTTASDGSYSFASLPSGTYTVTLTLPNGYQVTTTNPVTVPLTANTTQNFGIIPFQTKVTDTFTRSVSGGWGSANTGGSYTLTGTAAEFSVDGTEGIMDITASGSAFQKTALLSTISAQDIDETVRLKLDKIPVGNSTYTFLIGRHVSTGNEYRSRVRIDSSGNVYLQAEALLSSVDNFKGTETQVSGLTASASSYIEIHTQVTGINPTNLRMRAWADGSSEPGTWPYTATDSSALLQASGSAGLLSRINSGATNYPIQFFYDDYNVTTTDVAPTSTPTPTPPPTYAVSGTVYKDNNGNGVQDGGETGYQGATVTLQGVGSTTTDSSGNYSLTNVPAGTYTQTVTLPSGYLSTTSNPVSVPISANTTQNFGIQLATQNTIATDTYTRSVTNGFGTANFGGSYTLTGSSSNFSVDGTEGQMSLSATGSANQRTARLDSATAQNIDLTIRLKYDKLPNSTSGNYIFLIGRHVSSGNEYRGWIYFDNTGKVFLKASSIVSSAETQLGTLTQVPGLTYSAGNWIDVHLQIINANPTTINLNAWADGTSEPAGWQFTTTNSSSVLQQSGSIGMLTRLGNVTNTPVTSSFDDLNATSSAIITPSPTPTPTPTPVPSTPYSFSGNVTKVFTIVMENEDFSNIKGNTASAPYMNGLLSGINSDGSINTYHKDVAYATNYKNVLPSETQLGYLHPSEPNYIWLEAGTNQLSDVTFTSDGTPAQLSSSSSAHLATLLNNAGKTWKAYQENISASCPINSGTLFVPRHSPFVYFQDVSSTNAPGGIGTPSTSSSYCGSHEFDYSQFSTDLQNNTVGDYNFITPNLCDDMHNSSGCTTTDQIKNGDTWLQNNLPTILNSNEYKSGNAAVFIVWDEDSGSTTNHPIGMMAISPKTKGNGYNNNVAYSASSYVKTVEEIFGLSPLLGHANDAQTSDFSDLFGDPVIAAAGDIACGVGSGNASCQQQQTANLFSTIKPSAILPLGDNQYEQGALSDFQTYYDPTWGTYKTNTWPSVGNHEYLTANASGYFDYFNGSSVQTGQAGDRSKGYYSYDLGNWHLIALNTNCSDVGGCGPGSAQETFLKSDLAATSNKCILAYAHHPMFSSGQQPHNSGVDALYQDLYNAHADVYLVGHDHDYERFYPSDPNGLVNATNGITEFIVGTGGRNHTQLGSNGLLSNSAVFDATTFGVLKMTLHQSSFDWQFIPSASTQSFTNGTFTDSGTAQCHYISAAATPTPTNTPTPTPSQSYTVNGIVYTDSNSNGVQDNGETGYQGATVLLNGQTTTTDASGNYSFTNVSGGTYAISVQLPTNYQATTDDPASLSVTANTTQNFGIITNTSSFQPTFPLYSTFFYNWYKNPTTDGLNQWGIWADPDALGTHSPSSNWFSNYLPQPTPNSFVPATDLYSSNDYNIFKWQVSKLAEAKQEAAISSWWGQGDRSDIAFSHDILDYMNRSDNPYPNLRWALYYECEGNTCNGTNNPSVSQIVSDLNYIATNYANQSAYLKINGKPVIFVYADPIDGGTTDSTCSDNSMTSRWHQANQQAIEKFYVVLKVFSGYTTDVCQPDDWHQYSPAVRTDQQGTHAYAISPGFWRSGDSARLTRDINAFTSAVQNMVAANSNWKLTETWNEWGEGSAVEPGMQVLQATGSALATQDPNGTTFQNAYVNLLNIYLPNLPQGTGAITQTPTPTPATSTLSGTVYSDSNSNGIQDNGELGYQNATVTLSGATSASTTTGAAGNYSFTGLNAGTYTVTVQLPSGYQSTTTNPVTIPISQNTTQNFGISTLSLTPTPTSAITISNINASPSSNSLTITWTSSSIADTEVTYGGTSLYGTTITPTDINGVTNHVAVINSLLACTTYHFKVTSLDTLGNSITSGDNTATTTDCPGNATILSQTEALLSISQGGILNDLDQLSHGISLFVPSAFGSLTSVFEIHQLQTDQALTNTALPSNYKTIGNYTYDLEALTDPSTTQTSFNSPLTISIYYGNSDLAGVDPSTLTILHYHQGSWSNLSNCSVDTTQQVVSCQTSSFSLFTLVGNQPTSPSTNTSNNSSSSSGNQTCTNQAPQNAPNLYEVRTGATIASLYFVPSNMPYNAYTISYGPNSHDDYYAFTFAHSFSPGAINVQVNSLHRLTYYTFKVRANNGCQPGPWSKSFVVKTGWWPFANVTKYYAWQQPALQKTLSKKPWWKIW